MGENIILTGIVLAAIPIGEYDKRVTILTKERGKISAFVKGARRPNSSLMAASNPFVFGEFEVYQGRSSYNIYKALVSDYFNEITTDLNKVYFGCYFLEMADYFTRENNDEKEMLKLLYVTLKALSKGIINLKLIRYIYELKTLTINGEYPQCFCCSKCGNTDNLTGFGIKENGCICNECKCDTKDYIELDNSTIYALQYVISSDVSKLYTFKLSDKVFNEFMFIISNFSKKCIDKKFNTLDILDGIVNL